MEEKNINIGSLKFYLKSIKNNKNNNLRLIVPDNFKEVGIKVNDNINRIKGTNTNYIVNPGLVRFNNGEGKCIFEESIRGKDVYILSDVSNYSITYDSQVGLHHMMPDEHFQDIKRMINATCGHAKRIIVAMPYMYQSRQDKRNGRESLDLAMALGELKHYGVSEIITADVHNKSACDNASPQMPINNFYCSDDIILNLVEKEYFDFEKSMIGSPDFGAIPRANFYAGILGGLPLGVFYKQRDYSKVDNGLNPIKKHKFLYDGDIKGKDVIIVDDMIATGGSILDSAKQLKEKMKVNRVFLVATFGLFTKGYEMFDDAYKNKIFDRLYVTNLNYVPEVIKNKPWFEEVDCSMKLANIICNINEDKPIGNLLNAKAETLE